MNKAWVIPSLSQQLSDSILFAEILAPDELDVQTSLPGQPLGVLVDFVSQRLCPLGVVKKTNSLLCQVSAHGLGMADLWQSPGDYHPVKAGQNSKDPVRIPFRQHDHGRTLQRCRNTGSGNSEEHTLPSFRYLFGSGSAGLGREQRIGTFSEPPSSPAALDSSDDSVEGVHTTSSYAQSDLTAPSTQRAALPDPQSLYNSAYNDYLRGKYDLALRGFGEYLKNFPETELADNAAYWIGECHYRQGHYRQAVDQLEVVLSRYPRSDKAASVLLKKGYALIDLGDSSQGVMQLRQVILQYPTSDEANLARKRLRELGVDGG